MSLVGRTVQRLDEQRSRLQLHWMTVAFFAIVIAFADGFWLTSMQGAVGALERNEQPLGRWFRDSTLMLPPFFVGVAVALVLARRVCASSRSRVLKVGVAALLVTVIGSAVGMAEVAASSAYDYRLQTATLEQKVAFNHSHNDVPPAAAGTPAPTGCTGLCAQKELTMTTHLKAIKLAAGLLLVSNLGMVLWVLMFRGDRLWRSAPTDQHEPVVDSSRPVEAVLA
jgi:hypothetical protein